jgi:hypothetical protein
VDAAELSSLTRQLMKDRCDEWVQQLTVEKNTKILAGILSLLASWYGCGQRVSTNVQNQLIELTKKSLTYEGHQVLVFIII